MTEALYELETQMRLKSDAWSRDLDKSETKANRVFGRISGALGAIGLGVSAAGVARFLKESTLESLRFEKQLAMVGTMLDTQTKSMLPSYAAAIADVSMFYGQSTEVLSKGLYDILSAGIDATQAISVLEVGAQAAIAGITDTGTAIEAITTILNSYHMEADRADEVSDMLFATVKRGVTDFSSLAQQIGMAAATANLAGLSLDEFGASISTMTRGGVKTAQAMTSLNAVLNAFLKSTPAARKVAKDFGLELSTNTIKTIGLVGIMEKMKNATPEQVAAIIGSTEALKGFAAILKDLDGFKLDIDLQGDKAGATADAYATMSDTALHALDKLKQEFVDLRRTIGEEFSGLVGDMAEEISFLIRFWKREVKSIRDPETRSQMGVSSSAAWDDFRHADSTTMIAIEGTLKTWAYKIKDWMLALDMQVPGPGGTAGDPASRKTEIAAKREENRQEMLAMRRKYRGWMDLVNEGYAQKRGEQQKEFDAAFGADEEHSLDARTRKLRQQGALEPEAIARLQSVNRNVKDITGLVGESIRDPKGETAQLPRLLELMGLSERDRKRLAASPSSVAFEKQFDVASQLIGKQWRETKLDLSGMTDLERKYHDWSLENPKADLPSQRAMSTDLLRKAGWEGTESESRRAAMDLRVDSEVKYINAQGLRDKSATQGSRDLTVDLLADISLQLGEMNRRQNQINLRGRQEAN